MDNLKIAKKAQRLLKRNNNDFWRYAVVSQVEFDHYGDQYRDDQSLTYSEYVNSLISQGTDHKLAQLVGLFHFVLDVFSKVDTDYCMADTVIPVYHLQHVKEFSHAMKFCYLTVACYPDDSKLFGIPFGIVLTGEPDEIELIQSDRGFYGALQEFTGQYPRIILCMPVTELKNLRKDYENEIVRVYGEFFGPDVPGDGNVSSDGKLNPVIPLKLLKWGGSVAESRLELVEVDDIEDDGHQVVVYRFSGLSGTDALVAQNETVWRAWKIFEDTSLSDSNGTVYQKQNDLSYEQLTEGVRNGLNYSVVIRDGGSEMTFTSGEGGLSVHFGQDSDSMADLFLQSAVDNLKSVIGGRDLSKAMEMLAKHTPIKEEDQVAYYDAYSILQSLVQSSPQEFEYFKQSDEGKSIPAGMTQEDIKSVIKDMAKGYEQLLNLSPVIQIIETQLANEYADAYVSLAEMWKSGANGDRNYQKAAGWYMLGALNHSAKAEQYVANAMNNGNVCFAKDPDESAKWYLRAADDGVADAQYFTGVLYENGAYVEKDLDKALYYLKQSAEQNFAPAVSELEKLHKKMAAQEDEEIKEIRIRDFAQVNVSRIARNGNLMGRLMKNDHDFGQASICNMSKIENPKELVGKVVKVQVIQILDDNQGKGKFYRCNYLKK